MKRKVNGKKKVASSIGLLTAAVCCFGVAAATVTPNSDLYNDGVIRVYAAEETELKNWKESIAALESGDITTYSNYANYVMNFKTARTAYSSVSASITPEEQIIYDAANALVAVDADYYDYVASTLYNLKASSGIKWSAKAEHDNQATRFGTLNAERQGWLIKLIGVEDYNELTTYADGEFARIADKMDAVEVAIDAIKYKGKVDSKASLDVVATAITAVYGIEYAQIAKEEVAAMADYIGDNKLAYYDEACAEYAAIVTECAEFDARIIATYNDFTASGKYYTERLVIEALHRDYANMGPMQHGDAHDNRQTLIKESAKLFELVASVKSVDTHVGVLQTLIREIPAEFDYTDAYTAKVVAAREYYDANIIADLKAVVDASDVDAGIQGYTFLREAEAKIAKCKADVDALIERANNLQTLLDASSPDFVKEVNAVVAARATFAYEKQLADFNEKCGELVSSMRAKVANINATVTPVIEAIDAIGEVVLSDANIGARINNARTMYDALETQIEKASVTNYNKLVKAEEALAALTKDAEDWKVAVDAIVIDGKITVANIDAIDAVESTYTGWIAAGGDKADLANVVANAGTKYSYDKYTALVADRDALLASIATLAQDMAAISTDLEVISADPTVFTGAVEAAKTAFEALDTTVQARYFADENAANKAAYEHYVAALNLYNNVYKLVGNIIALGDPAAVTMAKYNDIKAYVVEYNGLTPENKAIVDNGGYTAKLQTAEATVDALKATRDAWIAKVYALAGDIAEEEWEAKLYSLDLDAVLELAKEGSQLDNTDKGLDEVVADFEKMYNIGMKRVNDMNASIDILAAKPSLEKADIETLKDIYNIYNEKLHKTQQEKVRYADFEPLYNRYVFAQNFDEAVDALYNDVVVNKNFTSEVPVVVGILRSVYVSMNDEMKQLIERYADIQKIEDAYVAFVADGGKVLNLKDTSEAVDKLDAMIKAINDADFATQIAAVKTELKGEITALDTKLAEAKLALENADAANKTELLGKVAAVQADLDAYKTVVAGMFADVDADIAALETKLNGVIDAVKTELKGEITALDTKLAQAKLALENADAANKTELLGKIATLQADLDAYKVLVTGMFADVDADIDALEQALNTAKAEIEAEIAALAEEIAAEIAALEKADAALKNEIDALRKSLTTVTVILSIVSGLALAGVVALFVLKFRKKN